MGSPVKIYVVRPGDRVSDDVSRITGIPAGEEVKVNLVTFLIEGGVLDHRDLAAVEEQARNIPIDPSRPTIVSGRGPHWLYGVFVHNLHFSRVLAVWEPRAKMGVVVEGPKDLVGMGLSIDGSTSEIDLGAKGKIYMSMADLGSKSLLHVEIKGDKFIEPRILRTLSYPEPPGGKPMVIEGLMPIWLGAKLTVEYVHKVPALAFYDPRRMSGIIFATHAEGYSIGDVIEVSQRDIERRRRSIAVGVVGDPNSGKSVFLQILNDVLRSSGYTTLTQEADITAPTQNWSLYSPDVRRELKAHMDPSARLRWIIESIATARRSGSVDVVLADVGGGRPDLGQRVTRENLAILSRLDGVVIVSRNDEGQISSWLSELSLFLPDLKVYGVVESRLDGSAWIDSEGRGCAVGIDRELYRNGRIPKETMDVARRIAERIARDDGIPARELANRELRRERAAEPE